MRYSVEQRGRPETFSVEDEFKLASGEKVSLFSIPKLAYHGFPRIGRLPISIRIILESLLRNFDGSAVTEEDVCSLAGWRPSSPLGREIPFRVSRVLMQDYTGVPALLDLAAMRDALARLGRDPDVLEPEIPVHLVIDHSVQVDAYGEPEALKVNIRKEFERNRERYQFLKWAQGAFRNLRIVPPGSGICHQVNLEHLATVVTLGHGPKGVIAFPDTLVGTDSHTTMVNGLGVLGWGVGGIEAEAALLGQPITILTPKVLGVHLTGSLREGVMATDAVLTITQMLRDRDVVGMFVEFFGEGVKALSVAERATISNMCPEYGATVALFPVDEEVLSYLALTGRSKAQVDLVRRYFEAQGMFGVPAKGDIDYSSVIELDLSTIEPSVSGPALPHERLSLSQVKNRFLEYLANSGRTSPPVGLNLAGASSVEDGFGTVAHTASPFSIYPANLKDGDIVIAAITSCTNTSNPQVMIAAGLLAKKAVERGLKVGPNVKTSLAPGSRVVTEYLARSGLLPYLEELGFSVVGYGCTTCIGNSGPLPSPVSEAVREGKLVVVSVLSGNRNFEARIHPEVRANFLMSPPLVVAYALAGTVLRDLSKEPIGVGADGAPVFLKEIWPSRAEVERPMASIDAEMYRRKYAELYTENEEWNLLRAPGSKAYAWDEESTYIRRPPFFEDFKPDEKGEFRDILGARALLILGDFVTTDHISPAGGILPDSPAGQYLTGLGVEPADFNSYGARRGNHEVMIRGAFANPRIKNKILADREGGFTRHYPDGQVMTVYEAALRYMAEGVPLIVFAGKGFGSGSSRDWAAKGQKLLGVRVVVAESFERIHRSNLAGMGILPLEFRPGENADSLGLTGAEVFDIIGIGGGLRPGGQVRMRFRRPNGVVGEVMLTVRLDSPLEVEYYGAGGILHYALARKARGTAGR